MTCIESSAPGWLCLNCDKTFIGGTTCWLCQYPLVSVSTRQIHPGAIPGFIVVAELESGSQGSIYLAKRLLDLTKQVAVKVLNVSLADDLVSVLRFRREAELLGSIKSENVVRVEDYGVLADGRPYLVMEFVDGYTCKSMRAEYGVLPVNQTIQILAAVANGLSHIHKIGIVHRDLKPENVIVGKMQSDWSSVKIVDFGIAKVRPLDFSDPLSLTLQNEVIGTPMYMSPEQCCGGVVDQRSDIYSLGCMMYEMLTGEFIFPAESTPVETMQRQIRETPKPMNLGFGDTGKKLEAITDRAINKNPNSRYFQASDLYDELKTCLYDEKLLIAS